MLKSLKELITDTESTRTSKKKTSIKKTTTKPQTENQPEPNTGIKESQTKTETEKPKPVKYALHIFRRDYRLVDNTALIEASRRATDGVILVFFFTYRQIKANPLKSNNCVQFLVESLEDLKEQIRENSGGKAKLHIYYTSDELQLLDKLLAANPDIGAVSWNQDYTAYAQTRDEKLAAVVKARSRELIQVDDILLMPYGSIVTGGGKPYTKFTPFLRATLAHKIRQPDHTHIKLASTSLRGSNEFTGDLKTFHDKVINPHLPEKGGRSQGLKILGKIGEWRDYTKKRDLLAYKTTHLSPFNKFGCVSIREVYWTMHDKLGSGSDLIRQIVWRDFFYNLSASHPYIYQKGAMNPKWQKSINWSTDPKLWQAWLAGRTGVPVVDACMREIAQTGYMHNRGRLIAANYLCRILSIDWRRGEKYFASQLYDYDPTQNSFGWQVNAAVSGTESRPMSQTILNPWIQSAKYDPDAEYIKQWVPELADIPAQHLHKWDKYGAQYANNTEMKKKLGGYPLTPLVDYEEGKRANLRKYGY